MNHAIAAAYANTLVRKHKPEPEISYHPSPLVGGYHVQQKLDGDWFGIGYVARFSHFNGERNVWRWEAYRRDDDFRGAATTRKGAAAILVREFDR